jgi:hypothetical protein
MACAKCPYQKNFELLWQDAADPEVICVLLRCCAGPDLQLRRGTTVLRGEIFKNVPDARARAEEWRAISPQTGDAVDFVPVSQ